MTVTFSSKNPKYDKLWAVLFPIILMAIGVGVILLGYFSIVKSNGWIKTTGIITDITRSTGADGTLYYKAFINYFVDGVEQKHVLLDAFENYFQVGITVNIKYNPLDLSQISYDNQGYFSVLYIVGGVISAVGVIIGVFVSPRMFKNKAETPM